MRIITATVGSAAQRPRQGNFFPCRIQLRLQGPPYFGRFFFSRADQILGVIRPTARELAEIYRLDGIWAQWVKLAKGEHARACGLSAGSVRVYAILN